MLRTGPLTILIMHIAAAVVLAQPYCLSLCLAGGGDPLYI